MNEIKFCANFFRKKNIQWLLSRTLEFTKLIARIPIYRSRGYPVWQCSVWQSSYITDEPNKPEQKHPLHVASYNHETRFRETSNW